MQITIVWNWSCTQNTVNQKGTGNTKVKIMTRGYCSSLGSKQKFHHKKSKLKTMMDILYYLATALHYSHGLSSERDYRIMSTTKIVEKGWMIEKFCDAIDLIIVAKLTRQKKAESYLEECVGSR